MTTLIAKPVIKDQFWIITDGLKKVGNIEANNAGYGVQINGTFLQFTNTEDLKKTTHITFESVKSGEAKSTHPYPEYPTPKRVYNSLFDIQRGLHLFTKTAKSKCLHAAGWFTIKHNEQDEVIFCPKYIFIQRYPYKGPFKTQDDAKNAINI